MVIIKYICWKICKVLIFEVIMVFLVLVNFILVLFNMIYIILRDFYFDYIFSLIKIYDFIKGIEFNWDIEKYLDIFEELIIKIFRGVDFLVV